MSIAQKLTDIAQNQQKVYEAGKKTQYDAFWNAYQHNGTRTHYREAFTGLGWTEEIFNPKYTITVVGDGERMFHASGIKNISLQRFDFSQMTHATFMFAESLAEHVGVLDLTNTVLATGIFFYMQELHTIDKLILNANGATKCNGSLLEYCPKLKNVTIVGMIAESTNMQGCNVLSRDSITSIVNALSTTTSGLTLTLVRTAVENAFGSTTAADWINLIGTRPNWTISLM